MKTVKDTNTPPWVDKEVRNLISRKYKALKIQSTGLLITSMVVVREWLLMELHRIGNP
jgi:hypothetical protein